MIEVDSIVPWSTAEHAASVEPAPGDVDIVASDLQRSLRFYSRVFGLHPQRRAWGESLAVIAVPGGGKLVIHDARAGVRRRARCVAQWAFVVADLDRARRQVWELGVTVSRDSGAPDHIYRRSNGRSLYINALDGHEIELIEVRSGDLERQAPRLAG